MSKIKKIVVSFTTLACAAMMLGMVVMPAQAITAEELQEQINLLLAQLTDLKAQLAELQGTGAVTVEGCEITSFDRNLSVAMTGDDVKCLQIVLNTASDTQVADSGYGAPGEETSYFGPLTKAAVIKFQEKWTEEVLGPWGLTSGTGFVGTTTRDKLNELLAGPVTPPTPTGCDCTDWVNVACGGGDCTATQMQQTRTCTPAEGAAADACDEAEITRCVADASCAVTAAGLTVALASDTPASGTIVADSTGTGADGAQAMAEMVKFQFSTPSGTSAKVTELKIKRYGISADTDISNMYLYDGDTIVADLPTSSSSYFTFSNSAGLFTVEGEKTITVKIDVANGTSSGKTFTLGINSSDDVITDAATVNGTFPVKGNQMSTATVSDLGQLDLEHVSDPGTSIQAGLTDQRLWEFSLTSADQKIKVDKIKLTVVGTIKNTDLANLYLHDGVSQLGLTMDGLDEDKTVTFNLSDSPYEIAAGDVQNISVRGDLIGGSARNFYFSVRNGGDVVAMDDTYGVYIKINQSDTFSIVKATNTTTIDEGDLQITKATDSPSGVIAQNKTNAVLAKFNVKAIGEAIKITEITVNTTVAAGTGEEDIDHGKLLVDGSQVGTTKDLDTDGATATGTTFTLGSQFVVNAGETRVLEIRADVKEGDGSTLTGTVQTDIAAGTDKFLRMSSGTSGNVPAATGNSLTVTASAITPVKNAAVANMTVIQSAQEVLVGSWLLTAGASEGVDVSQVVVVDHSDVSGLGIGDAFNNLELYSSDVKYGQTIVSPGTGEDATATFSLSTPLNVPAGQSVQIDLKANVLGNADDNWTDTDEIAISSVTGKGATTNRSVSYTTAVAGQQITVSTAGTLTVANAASPAMPSNSLVVAGHTDVTVAAWDFTADNTEALNIQAIKVYMTGANTPGNFKNLKLYVSGSQVGGAIPAITAATGNLADASTTAYYGYAYFIADPLFIVPKGDTVTCSLKADVTAATNVGTWHLLPKFGAVLPTETNGQLTSTSEISAKGASSGIYALEGVAADTLYESNIMKVVKTKPVFALNSASPSGTLVPGTVEVIRFDVIADSKYKVVFNAASSNNIKFSITAGETSTSTTSRAFDLYDASTNTTVATQVTTTPNDGNTVDFAAGLNITIPAGATKTFYVKANLADYTSEGESFQLSILNAADDLSFNDGSSTTADVNQASYLELGLPIYGNTLVKP